MTIESFIIFAIDNYRFLIQGVFVALTALILIFKLVLPKSPKEALTMFVGADRLYFKARSFQEKSLWGNSVPKTCEDIKIELYKVQDDTFSFHALSIRRTLASAPIQLEEPIQIRFKYKDGLFWTAWSQIIKKTIRRPPFQLQVYTASAPIQPEEPIQIRFKHNDGLFWTAWSQIIKKTIRRPPFQLQVSTETLDNHQQPAQTQENFYNNLCQEFRQRINNARNVNIRLMGRLGTGKSSLINTFSSAFTTNWRVVATTYGKNGSITKVVTRHELVPGQAHVVDMPGWQADDTFRIMGDIVRGMYDGMQPQMKQIDEGQRKGQKVNQTPGLNEGPGPQERNAIIFVIAAEDAKGDDVNPKILKEIIELGYPCIAVVTKVDKLAEEGEESITQENFYTDPRVVDCCHKLRSLGIDYILPMINYAHQGPQNPKINYVALHALDEAIRLAQ